MRPCSIYASCSERGTLLPTVAAKYLRAFSNESLKPAARIRSLSTNHIIPADLIRLLEDERLKTLAFRHNRRRHSGSSCPYDDDVNLAVPTHLIILIVVQSVPPCRQDQARRLPEGPPVRSLIQNESRNLTP